MPNPFCHAPYWWSGVRGPWVRALTYPSRDAQMIDGVLRKFILLFFFGYKFCHSTVMLLLYYLKQICPVHV